ncbi:MAG: GlsB/YeaQ/YmgE family stress response membrane protein [Cyanobacteria bacterium J069]|nr:MAG: GlsB/YeaQ/YmgE family stress response membrane protein [Cyanobacteria bacterium J069]
MTNLLTWLVLGFVAGALAKLVYPGRQGGGIFATTLLGILGAMLGGWLGTLILGGAVTGLNLPSIVLAVIGSMLLIFLWGSFARAA